MAIINNLMRSLLNNQGFDNHAPARRMCDAHPQKTLSLICGFYEKPDSARPFHSG
jgi:hypothetical protein